MGVGGRGGGQSACCRAKDSPTTTKAHVRVRVDAPIPRNAVHAGQKAANNVNSPQHLGPTRRWMGGEGEQRAHNTRAPRGKTVSEEEGWGRGG
jgi:hypothetical protein